MKKMLLSFFILILFLAIILYANEKASNRMWNKFIEDYSYELISKQDSVYYNQFVEANHGMWYYESEIQFMNDSIFTVTNKSTYFQAPLFPVKYYLGLLEFEPEYMREYTIRNNKVYSDWYSDSIWTRQIGEAPNYVGTITFKKDSLIFQHAYY